MECAALEVTEICRVHMSACGIRCDKTHSDTAQYAFRSGVWAGV